MKNWKTTVAGLAIAAITAWSGCTSHDPKQIAAAVVIAVVGYAMKDDALFGPAK